MDAFEPSDRPSPRSFFKLANSPFVTILVGPEEVKFELPKNLLITYAPFFKAALDGNFKEAKEGLLRLPEDDPVHFRLFTNFVRDGSIKFPSGEEASFVWNLVPFVDKYDIRQLWDCLKKQIKKCIAPDGESDLTLDNFGSTCWQAEPEEVDLFLSRLSRGDPVLQMFATASLQALQRGAVGNLVDDELTQSTIRKMVHRNDNLAAEMVFVITQDPDTFKENDDNLIGFEIPGKFQGML